MSCNTYGIFLYSRLKFEMLEIYIFERKLNRNSLKCAGRLQWQQQHHPHGTLQMVNRPVTMGTIDDYMHEGNGQKSEHPQRDDPEVLKPAGL